jgi:hypothetical protein
MIYIFHYEKDQQVNGIVRSAFERSCGVGSTKLVSNAECIKIINQLKSHPSAFNILVIINPDEEFAPLLIEITQSLFCKIIIFGSLPNTLACFLGATTTTIPGQIISASMCKPALKHQSSESLASVFYNKVLGLKGYDFFMPPPRSLCRFDFTDEWNNLGFGAITTDGSIWSMSQCVLLSPENILAKVMVEEKVLSAYCGLWDFERSSLIWFNRSVGPVDSYEWYLLEQFISEYRFSDIPSWPVISEIPFGYESAVTMRLDCDEDIESARSLGKAYIDIKVPLSLALHAAVLSNPDQHQFPKEILTSGGCLLSHTLTHASNWGGSEASAINEGAQSAAIIGNIVGEKPRYAVSPFHHTPPYARVGLAKAGYKGCVGGIISSDPDFLMARAGYPPGISSGFIGHTQQCMLHGDCLLKDGDPLAVYKKAYDQAKLSKTFFGYLDHPFSPRYQYGWISEEERIQSHVDFIDYIRNTSENVIFLNQNDALDFLGAKASIRIEELGEELHLIPSKKASQKFAVSIKYRAQNFRLNSENIAL